MFDDLRGYCEPGGVLEGMRQLTEQEMDQIRLALPTAPSDYLRFLTDIGCGRVGRMLFNLLSAPIPIEDMFPHADISDVMLVGDDFAGFCYGYRRTGFGLLEIDSASWSVSVLKRTFETFIREIIVGAVEDHTRSNSTPT